MSEGNDELRSDTDFVRFVQPPTKLSSQLFLTIEYGCSKPSIVGYELRVYSETQSYIPVVLKTWECDPSDTPKRKIENLSLPPYLGYKPGYFNKYSVTVNSCVLQAWLLDPVKFTHERRRSGKSFYYLSTKKVKHRLKVLPAMERPAKPMDRCLSWWLSYKTSVPFAPVCNIERGKWCIQVKVPQKCIKMVT